jgi:hypothetical protein
MPVPGRGWCAVEIAQCFLGTTRPQKTKRDFADETRVREVTALVVSMKASASPTQSTRGTSSRTLVLRLLFCASFLFGRLGELGKGSNRFRRHVEEHGTANRHKASLGKFYAACPEA